MTILNKVQYFQNKCGCNKILVYLYKKKKKNHPNYDNIINKAQQFQNNCGCLKQLCNSPWSP